MANDKDFRVKNGLLVATDTTDLNSQGQIINSGSLGSFINFVDINTEFPETKATIGGNIDLDFSAYSYKINDNNMLWHGEGYVDTNTVVGKNAGTTTDYTSSNLTLLGHGAEPSSPTATNEVTLGDSNVKSFRIPGVGMSVDSTGLLTVNDISISGDITIDSDLVVNTIQVNDSARVTGNFTVDTDTLHVDATNNRVGIGTTTPDQKLTVQSKISFKASNGATRGLIGSPSWDESYIAFQNGTLAEAAGNAALYQNTAGVTSVNAADGQNVQLKINNSTGLILASTSNVGIGTLSPSEKLHLRSASGGSVKIRFDDAVATRNNYIGVVNYEQITIAADEGATAGAQPAIILKTASAERMRIDAAGNVGIGTTNPGTALDVTGTVTADTFSFANWTVTESDGSLYFATGGINKMKLDSDGNLDVVGYVNANATIS